MFKHYINLEKESRGKKVVEEYHVFERLFNCKEYIWNEDVESQIKGIDWIIEPNSNNPIYVDMKYCNGPNYDYKSSDSKLPVNIITKGLPITVLRRFNTSYPYKEVKYYTKSNHFFLYIIEDYSGLSVYLISNDRMCELIKHYLPLSVQHENKDKDNIYIKIPTTSLNKLELTR